MQPHTHSVRPPDYKTWVHPQTQNKAQWLAACWQVSASSQPLRFILSLRLCWSVVCDCGISWSYSLVYFPSVYSHNSITSVWNFMNNILYTAIYTMDSRLVIAINLRLKANRGKLLIQYVIIGLIRRVKIHRTSHTEYNASASSILYEKL